MTTRYVGIGGNDGNSGLTWALRKLTLFGAESTPVVAGDDVYVGPGVYREDLPTLVAGNLGNPITYIGDVTGEHTDSVGGIVRITGSNNDQTKTRNFCIEGSHDYRIFRGFTFDLSASALVFVNEASNWIIEDCTFQHSTFEAILFFGDDPSDNIVRRCVFAALPAYTPAISFDSANGIQDASSLVENCTFIGFYGAVASSKVGGIDIRNCTCIGCSNTVEVRVALPGGFTAINVENCNIINCNLGLTAINVGEIVEDFNNFRENSVDRTNVNVGGNSETFPSLMALPLLHSGVLQISGFKFPWWFGELSEWSLILAITGSNEPTEDLRGIARPVTASKNSWGSLQFVDMERETGTVRTGSASMAIRDAGRHQIWVPVTATSTTIRVYVYREANYAGLLPQMIIKQPGQADDVTTDVGAAGGWNLLTTTLVPAADPPYVVVELVSRNTNGAADETFFDDLDVS